MSFALAFAGYPRVRTCLNVLDSNINLRLELANANEEPKIIETHSIH
jgi:hypothetical protein